MASAVDKALDVVRRGQGVRFCMYLISESLELNVQHMPMSVGLVSNIEWQATSYTRLTNNPYSVHCTMECTVYC